jgi:hypothetical protein
MSVSILLKDRWQGYLSWMKIFVSKESCQKKKKRRKKKSQRRIPKNTFKGRRITEACSV